jgi:glycosyltransferase involved in cell wall biosynthesis
LEFIPGEEILLADHPAQFADAVARLLHDTELRRKMGNAARQRVQRNYDMNTLRAALRQALSHVNLTASGRRRAAPQESRA